MKALFGNSGKRICVLATVICIIGLATMGLSLLCTVFGLIIYEEEFFFVGIIGLFSGAFLSFSTLFLYAIGQLVSDTHEIKEKLVDGKEKTEPVNAFNAYQAPQPPMYQAPQSPMYQAPQQPVYNGYPMQNQ